VSRKGKERPLGQGLSQIISSLDRKSGGAYTQARVGILWQELAGPMVTSHTTGAHLRDGTLVIYVDGPAWATELTAMSETYRKRINEDLGKNAVRNIRFTVSRKVAEEFRLRRTELEDEEFYLQDVVDSVPLTKTEREQVEASTECIPDETLREAAVRATVADLEWKKGMAARNAREAAREGS